VQKADDAASKNNSAPATPPQPAVNTDKEKSASQNQQPDSYDPRNDTLYRCYLLATIVGVIGGLIAIVVLICQTFYTAISAKAALLAAESSNQNATSVMVAERAWVIATPIQDDPGIGFIPEPGDPNPIPGTDRANMFSVSFKNTGNTPARLVESAVRYQFLNRLEDLSPEPEYGPRGLLERMPLVKGDSIGAFAFLQPNTILTSAQATAVRRSEAFLCAYGILVYEDVFGRSHETRFGYVYFFPRGGDVRPRGFRREGLPSAYNSAT
jgi:hypothetical protein